MKKVFKVLVIGSLSAFIVFNVSGCGKEKPKKQPTFLESVAGMGSEENIKRVESDTGNWGDVIPFVGPPGSEKNRKFAADLNKRRNYG